MNKLPSEILHNIFIRVPFKEKLECMLVCRHWYTLVNRSLLNQVEIYSDNSLNKFIRMLKRQGNRRLQVETLKLEINHFSERCRTFDKRKLYNILPNLRVYQYKDYVFSPKSTPHRRKPFELEQPDSKLEMVRDDGDCEITKQLVMFGSCTRLRHLELGLTFIDNAREEIFSHLKNIPSLKKLVLCNCIIGIQDIEVVHHNTPALESFELYKVVIIPENLPPNIIPNTCIKTLLMNINKVMNYPDYPDWYRYLARKFTNLTSFEYCDPEMNNFDSSLTMAIYLEGLFPIYKTTGQPLPYFEAKDITTELNPFNTLDEHGLRVTHFHLLNNGTRPIFDQLALSNQSGYTDAIKITNSAIATPMMLQRFTSLGTIDIDSSGIYAKWNVDLCDYFNAFPVTLTTFRASFLDADITTLPLHPNNIQCLDLHCSTLYPKLGEVISGYCPKLNKLRLGGLVAENLDIHLPRNHFKKLDIAAEYDGDRAHGFLISSSGTRSQCYMKRSIFGKPELVSFGEIHNRVTISIQYATSEETYFDSFPIVS